MAKGRKLGASDRHERLLGTYGYANGHGLGTGNPDLSENDVWLTSPSTDWSTRAGYWAGNDSRHVGGLSLAFESSNGYGMGPKRHVVAASSPVNVPIFSSNGGLVEADRDEPEWVPPHEYLAREHGRSVSTSVFEGVGRTLKGRDMSRVRDAVWSKTGFFG